MFSREVLDFPSAKVQLFWHLGEAPYSSVYSDIQPQLSIVEKLVHKAHSDRLSAQHLHLLPGGEAHKTWKDLESVLSLFLKEELRRDSLVWAVGGGAHLDLIAFATSIYQRGIAFVSVPSTLLAMVDAAIGGKNGINFKGYKNLVGTIVQPSALIIDTQLLCSLAQSAWSDGFAEIIKYACIADRALFVELSTQGIDVYRSNKEALRGLIHRCIRHKLRIVAEDESDLNRHRVLLNFGHSLAHALERTQGYSHGQAVASGMMFSAWMSVEKGLLSAKVYEQLVSLLSRYGLGALEWLDPEALFEHFLRDKKRLKDGFQEVLLKDIAQPSVVVLELPFLRNCLARYSTSCP